jgi:hypothetical protein
MKEHIDILIKRREEKEKNEVHGSPTTTPLYTCVIPPERSWQDTSNNIVWT